MGDRLIDITPDHCQHAQIDSPVPNLQSTVRPASTRPAFPRDWNSAVCDRFGVKENSLTFSH